MKDVIVGYSGGKSPFPTYRSIGDHTESVRILFDPSIISYEHLLRSMLEQLGDAKFSPSYSCQYRSAIFFHLDIHYEIASSLLSEVQKASGKKIMIDLEQATSFYRAEEYHQKFVLKQKARGW